MNDFDEYIDQYKSGLITKSELVEKLGACLPPVSKPISVIRSRAQTNCDLLRDYVIGDCCCHWGFFRENCPENEMDAFCNVDVVRTTDEIRKFVNQYI